MPKGCELRITRRPESDGGGLLEIVCGAGDFRLGIAGMRSAEVEAVCDSCPVPEEIVSTGRPCLYMRPVRLVEDGEITSYFACRYFYSITPKWQATSVRGQCPGCPHWFPRPAVNLIPGYWRETAKLRQAMAGLEEQGPHPKRVPPTARQSWWHRLRFALFW